MNKINDYKTKGVLLGIVLLVVMLGAFMISTSKASADCTILRTLSVGSTGPDVQCLQTSLGITSDGVFGPFTRAAVVAFQANNGLVTDGIFGPLSRYRWQNHLNVKQNSPSNTQTQTICPNGNTLASNCTLPVGVNAQVICPNGNTLASNCTISPYSNTVNNDSLSGGAGDVIFTQDGTGVEYDVREGDIDRKILGFRTEANGSDISIRDINVSFTNNTSGSSSTRLDRYVKNVSVWENGVRVGYADVSEFMRNGITYSKNIALSNAVIREGSSNRVSFYIAVTAVPNIDSVDLASNNWEVKVRRSDIRFIDATGAILLGGPTSDIITNPSFISLASSGNVKVKIIKGTDNPVASNVQVSDYSDTPDVKMLEFNVRSEGTNVTFDSMSFNVDASGSGNVQDIISELALYHGSTRIGDIASFNRDGIYKINLYNDLTIYAGNTETFKIMARVKRIGVLNFIQGDSLLVSAANPLFSGTIEDMNGDRITNIAGTVVGERQTFYSEGIKVSNFNSSAVATTTQNGIFAKQTYSISFNVTAFGNTYYIPMTVARDSDSNSGLLYIVQVSSGSTVLQSNNVVASSSSSLSSNAQIVGNYFEIPDGETKTFTVTIVLSNTGTNMVTGFYRVHLDSVRYDINQNGTPDSYVLTPVQNYNTADRQLDSM